MQKSVSYKIILKKSTFHACLFVNTKQKYYNHIKLKQLKTYTSHSLDVYKRQEEESNSILLSSETDEDVNKCKCYVLVKN